MTKFLLLALLIFAVLWGPLSRLRGAKRETPQEKQTGSSQTPSPGARQDIEQAQDIVPCAHCGVHLPRNDALTGPEHGRGQLFCSAEHRRLGPRSSVA